MAGVQKGTKGRSDMKAIIPISAVTAAIICAVAYLFFSFINLEFIDVNWHYMRILFGASFLGALFTLMAQPKP